MNLSARLLVIVVTFIALTLSVGSVWAQNAPPSGGLEGPVGGVMEPTDNKLRVGVYEAPPMAHRSADGAWEGIAVDLWTRVAQMAELQYEFIEIPRRDAPELLADGAIDVLAISRPDPEHAASTEWTPSYYAGSFAVAQSQPNQILDILERLFSKRFLWISGVLAVMLLVVGTLIWLAERRANTDQFEEAASKGLWSGFWWAGVTMTTIGYGDKAPVTVLGRILALLWMLVAMAVTAALTASLTSVLALGPTVGGASVSVEDLQGREVVAVKDSAAATFLADRGIDFKRVASVKKGVSMIRDHDSTALVAPDASLGWHLSGQKAKGLVVQRLKEGTPPTYALALPEQAPFEAKVDAAVVHVTFAPSWSKVLERYLGGSKK